MSLLMEALKRAEANKQKAAGDDRAPAGLALEPLAAPPAAGNGLPNLDEHIAGIDAELAAAVGKPSRPAAAAPTAKPLPESQREAVRNAFAAKTAAPRLRNYQVPVLGLLAATVLSIGGYFWYQLNNLGKSSLAKATMPPQAAPYPVAPPAPQTVPTMPAPAAALGTATPADAPPAAAPPAPAAPPATTARPLPTPLLADRRSEPAVRQPEPPARQPEANPAAAPATPVRLLRSRPEIDPHLKRAYQNLQAGRVEAARTDYELALRADARNVDALLGLAAIAQHEGRGADAERHWQQAIEADPKDAGAQAASVGVAAAADPVAAESRLKTLLSAQPESAPLNFALANLYARQNRWAEAQQAYFNAVAADGDNPDYLFNLAVSLDHLRQPRLAAQHYRLALEAGERRPAAFDRERTRQRLLALQP